MRPVTEREIEEYVESGESMDKAGAYAIQGEGKKFIDKIEGSYSNVVGLPLETVKEMINNFVCDINAQKF
jgi:septum formation protein